MGKINKSDIKNYYEDLELVNKIIAKDSEALEKLYLKYCKRLTCFLNTFVASYDDVQDILQNTFIAALDSLEDYKGTSQFSTWIFGIARHKIGDYYRVKQKDVGPLGEFAGDEWRAATGDSAPSVEEWLLDRELSLEIQTVLGRMPEHYQSLLIEKYIQRKTVKELAASRTMSEKAVESLLTRARRRFKDLAGEHEYFSEDGFYE